MQALFRIGKGELPPVPNSLSSDAQDFILKCLQVNPSDQPTAGQLLDHLFLIEEAAPCSLVLHLLVPMEYDINSFNLI